MNRRELRYLPVLYQTLGALGEGEAVMRRWFQSTTWQFWCTNSSTQYHVSCRCLPVAQPQSKGLTARGRGVLSPASAGRLPEGLNSPTISQNDVSAG